MNKKLQKLIMLLIAFTVIQAKAQQVTVTSTAGSGAGSTGGYSSLISAFSDINSGIYQGDINIRIHASFSMSASAVLNASGTGSALYTTVVIRPADTSTVTKQVSTTTAALNLIELNGADSVVIDGRAGGTGTSSLLEFANNFNSGTASSTSVTMRLNNGATRNEFRYVSFTNASNQAATNGAALGASNASNSCNIAFMNTTVGSSANSNNSVKNCVLTGARLSMFFDGTNALSNANMDNIVIQNNQIRDFASRGIDVNNNVGTILIDSNRIFYSSGYTSTNGAAIRAISLGSGTASATNRMTATVTKNRIYDLKLSGFTNLSITSIIIQPPSTSPSTYDIVNNSIVQMQTNSGVTAGATGGLVGIIFTGANSATVNVYNNTVRLGGFITLTGMTNSSIRSYAFGKFNSGASSVLNVQNNLFINTRTGGTMSNLAVANHMGAWYNTNTTGTNNINNNTYNGTGQYVMGWGGFVYTTFAGAYQTAASPNDANSTFKSPAFTNTQQPYLTGASLGDADLSATRLTAAPTDIDNASRPTTCYKGAFESSTQFVTNDLAATIIYTYGKVPVGTLDSVRVRFKSNGVSTLTNSVLSLRFKGASGDTTIYLTVPSIAPLSDVIVKFPGFTPLNIGYDTITASMPAGDQNTANDQVIWVRENTLNALSYTRPFQTNSGTVGTNPQGEMLAKFNTPVSNFVNQVNVNFNTAGLDFQIVIYEDSGSTWGPKRNPLYVSSTQQTIVGVFNLSLPSIAIRSGDFFVGVRQTTANNVGFAYQTENPIRTNTFYFRQGATFNTLAWNDFAPNNFFRFMIEPRLKINNDLGITSLVSPSLCAGSSNATVSVNVQNLGLLKQDFAVNPLSVSGTATDPNGAITSFGPIVINSDTLTSDGNLVVTLSNTYNMSTAGNYTFNAWSKSNVDINASNDTLPAVTRTAVTPVSSPYAETFNASLALPNGWTSTRFAATNGAGKSSSNGMRVNIFNSVNAASANAILTSPRITGATAASQLRFDYRVTDRVGGAATTLGLTDAINVYISTDCGTSYSLAKTIDMSNHIISSSYNSVAINLASYIAGGNDLRVKFSLDWFGTGNDSYIDFDDIRFIDTTNDVKPTNISGICASLPLGASLNVTSDISNLGTSTANTVSYGITINGAGSFSNSSTITAIVGGASSSIAFSSFTPSAVGTYNVRIYNNYSSDNDIYNDTVYRSFTVFAGIDTFTISNLTTSSFTINWSAITGATSYNLDVASDPSFNSILVGYNNLTVSGTSQSVTGLSSGVTYYYRVRTTNSCGTSINSRTNNATTLTLSTPLTLTAYLQGLYLGGSTMIAAPIAALGTGSSTVADTVTIELHDATSPYALVSTTIGTIGTNGVGNISLPPTASGGTYYIVLKHRNSITTWSSNPVTFNNSSNSYNFSTGVTQAFGDNLVNVGPGVYAIFSGDINQDGSVDFNDYPGLDIASSAGVLGYDSNDLNGDASVDFNDYPVLDVNSSLGVISVNP